MPEFGKHVAGGTAFSVFFNEYDSTKFTMPEDGTVTELWADCENPDSVNIGFELGCYSDSAGLPNSHRGHSDELVLLAGAVRAWRQFVVSTPFFLAAGVYHLGHFGYSGAGVTVGAKVYGDIPGGNVGAWAAGMIYPDFDLVATGNADTIAYSIYAVYTAAVHLDSVGPVGDSTHFGPF